MRGKSEDDDLPYGVKRAASAETIWLVRPQKTRSEMKSETVTHCGFVLQMHSNGSGGLGALEANRVMVTRCDQGDAYPIRDQGFTLIQHLIHAQPHGWPGSVRDTFVGHVVGKSVVAEAPIGVDSSVNAGDGYPVEAFREAGVVDGATAPVVPPS